MSKRESFKATHLRLVRGRELIQRFPVVTLHLGTVLVCLSGLRPRCPRPVRKAQEECQPAVASLYAVDMCTLFSRVSGQHTL